MVSQEEGEYDTTRQDDARKTNFLYPDLERENTEQEWGDKVRHRSSYFIPLRLEPWVVVCVGVKGTAWRVVTSKRDL